jgi:hypothetical protein
VLGLQKPRIDSGAISDLKFMPHADDKARRDSADGGCYPCQVVSDKIRALDASRVGSLDDGEKQRTSLATLRWIRPSYSSDDRHTFTSSIQHRGCEETYRQLSSGRSSVCLAIPGPFRFVPKTTSFPSETLGRQAVSSATSSPEVFQLAKSWIEECETHHDTCKPDPSTVYCPTRLLDLEMRVLFVW